jgi:predicted enzyme related to lactoylglutathione lyase
MHIRLPGGGAHGPTLEIFEYSEHAADVPHVINRPGFAHIAFAVDSVPDAREQVISNGGSPVGDVVTVTISATARVTWCYVRDPEGNIIELQRSVTP